MSEFESLVDAKEELEDKSVLVGTVIELGDTANTLDIDFEGTVGRIDNIPVHYHCQESTEIADGWGAFAADDEVYVLCAPAELPSAENLKVIGFADGFPRRCPENKIAFKCGGYYMVYAVETDTVVVAACSLTVLEAAGYYPDEYFTAINERGIETSPLFTTSNYGHHNGTTIYEPDYACDKSESEDVDNTELFATALPDGSDNIVGYTRQYSKVSVTAETERIYLCSHTITEDINDKTIYSDSFGAVKLVSAANSAYSSSMLLKSELNSSKSLTGDRSPAWTGWTATWDWLTEAGWETHYIKQAEIQNDIDTAESLLQFDITRENVFHTPLGLAVSISESILVYDYTKTLTVETVVDATYVMNQVSIWSNYVASDPILLSSKYMYSHGKYSVGTQPMYFQAYCLATIRTQYTMANYPERFVNNQTIVEDSASSAPYDTGVVVMASATMFTTPPEEVNPFAATKSLVLSNALTALINKHSNPLMAGALKSVFF